jgi:beta-aspartyl-peptidase (threonine type)
MRVLLGCTAIVLMADSLTGCGGKGEEPGPPAANSQSDGKTQPTSKKPPPAPKKGNATKTVLVIHGGAGVLEKKEMKKEGLRREHYEEALARALGAGYRAWKEGKSSVVAVEAAIRVMEDSGLFNAGRGAAFTSDGRVELDAAIMEGRMNGKGEGKRDPRKRAGAVTGVSHIRNPISAARAVMEMKGSPQVMLSGAGAEAFALGEPSRAKKYRIERVSNLYFWSDRRLRQIREEFKRDQAERKKKGVAVPPPDGQRGQGGGSHRRLGTVGAVALDRHNNLAAGTSTGGLTNKHPGRVGDSPVIGAGTYADDRACGVSCTGTGEVFIRHAVAHDVVARMLYAKHPVEKAAAGAIEQLPDEEGGVGGLIALDKAGKHSFAMSKKSDGMYRGYVTENGRIFVAIFRDEKEKRFRSPKGKGSRPKRARARDLPCTWEDKRVRSRIEGKPGRTSRSSRRRPRCRFPGTAVSARPPLLSLTFGEEGLEGSCEATIVGPIFHLSLLARVYWHSSAFYLINGPEHATPAVDSA